MERTVLLFLFILLVLSGCAKTNATNEPEPENARPVAEDRIEVDQRKDHADAANDSVSEAVHP